MIRALVTHWKLYVAEALGLAIFMISACFFGALLESSHSSWHRAIPDAFTRTVIMGLLMGGTAVFIFYSRWTAPSGAQINPAVTLTFLRLKKISGYDTLYYIVFQIIGGTLAVCAMVLWMGKSLTDLPVHYAVTVPGKAGAWPAAIMEFSIGFVMMTMVLFTSTHKTLSRYTKIIAGCLVCCYVIVAGPVSGFGMNPARTLASAWPANTWTALWIYMIIPVISMLCAAEFFLRFKSIRDISHQAMWLKQIHFFKRQTN